jgi:hypothetical protein
LSLIYVPRQTDPKKIITMTSDNNNSGMTVNERLYAADLLDAFYRAANKRDRYEMIALLMSVDFEKTQAEQTADDIINNPAFTEE